MARLRPMKKAPRYRGAPGPDDDLGEDFETEHLYSQWNGVFATKDHPLFSLGTVAPQDTLTYPWLCLFSGQEATDRIGAYFRDRDLPEPKLALEAHSLQIAFRMIRDHQFLACMPRPLALLDKSVPLVEIPLKGFPWSIPTGITYHKRSQDFAPVRQLIRSLKRSTKMREEAQQ